MQFNYVTFIIIVVSLTIFFYLLEKYILGPKIDKAKTSKIEENKRDLFCYPDCMYLSVTEAEQDKDFEKPPHICHKYKKQVKHHGYHPKLRRLDECRYERIEEK